MKNIALIFLIVLCTLCGRAQQSGMFNHFYYKQLIYNPGYTGASDYVDALIIRHDQWRGFKDAPQLHLFTLDAHLKNEKTGLGLSLISDKRGISNRVGGALYYAYRTYINQDLHLALGLNLGAVSNTLDYSRAVVQNANDPALFADRQQQYGFDGNAGIVLTWKDLELGVSVPQLFGNRIHYSNASAQTAYTQVRHYLTSVKYKVYIDAEQNFSLAPLALIRVVPGSPLQYEANVNVDWKRKLWIGTTYKSDYAISANIGFALYKHLYTGYSYDFILGNLGQEAGTSHEIMLNYKFGKTKSDAKLTENKPVEVQREALKERHNDKDPMPELNRLITLQLLHDIETILDRKDVGREEINALTNRINSFLDSDFGDTATSGMLKKYYSKLNETDEPDFIVVKGTIKIDKMQDPESFRDMKITLTNKETGKIIGVYMPNQKNGKYIMILNPGEKYSIRLERDGQIVYTKELVLTDKGESYEIEQEIHLKK